MTRLEDVNLARINITNVQIQALFTEMSQYCQLRKLNLCEKNLSSLEPQLFARVVTRLEDVNLSGTNTTDLQIQALFTEMSQNSPLGGPSTKSA